MAKRKRSGGRPLRAGPAAGSADVPRASVRRAFVAVEAERDPVEQAQVLGDLLEDVDRELLAAIDRLRGQGVSWSTLRPIFRVSSPQAVQQRVARLRTSLDREP